MDVCSCNETLMSGDILGGLAPPESVPARIPPPMVGDDEGDEPLWLLVLLLLLSAELDGTESDNGENDEDGGEVEGGVGRNPDAATAAAAAAAKRGEGAPPAAPPRPRKPLYRLQ